MAITTSKIKTKTSTKTNTKTKTQETGFKIDQIMLKTITKLGSLEIKIRGKICSKEGIEITTIIEETIQI